jgi:hypothetical protein
MAVRFRNSSLGNFLKKALKSWAQVSPNGSFLAIMANAPCPWDTVYDGHAGA